MFAATGQGAEPSPATRSGRRSDKWLRPRSPPRSRPAPRRRRACSGRSPASASSASSSSWSCSARSSFTQAPQFLSASNLTQVTAHASIIAVAAVGEAIVILTRNVDLSIEAMIGLVAFAVADILASQTVGAPVAILVGVGLGLVLGS